MNYSIEQAELLARQLEGLATREAHQLAGHVANVAAALMSRANGAANRRFDR